MTGEAVVVSTHGNTATVKIKRSSACGHDCGECNLCKNPDIEVEVLNPIDAVEGDRVKVGTDTSKVLKDAFLLYMLPVLGALILCILLYSLNAKTQIYIVLETLWIALWYVFIKHYNKHSVTMSCILEVLK